MPSTLYWYGIEYMPPYTCSTVDAAAGSTLSHAPASSSAAFRSPTRPAALRSPSGRMSAVPAIVWVGQRALAGEQRHLLDGVGLRDLLVLERQGLVLGFARALRQRGELLLEHRVLVRRHDGEGFRVGAAGAAPRPPRIGVGAPPAGAGGQRQHRGECDSQRRDAATVAAGVHSVLLDDDHAGERYDTTVGTISMCVNSQY